MTDDLFNQLLDLFTQMADGVDRLENAFAEFKQEQAEVKGIFAKSKMPLSRSNKDKSGLRNNRSTSQISKNATG